MTRLIDATGQRFGSLVVLQRDEEDRRRVVCRCDCGETCKPTLGNLRSGNTSTCGCGEYRPHPRKQPGETLGRYTVLRDTGENKLVYDRTCPIYEVKCNDCGYEMKITSRSRKNKCPKCREKWEARHKGKHGDLTGRRFGRWLVLSFHSRVRSGLFNFRKLWLCLCECGREKTVGGNTLLRGKSRGCRSCGRRNQTVQPNQRKGVSKIGSSNA